MNSTVEDRAREISEFFGIPYESALFRLSLGFHYNHAQVAQDFEDHGHPESAEDLLSFYRDTEQYIYELSAYHQDEGFNYSGMCEGIARHLKAAGKLRVLCLGDGIGDLSIACSQQGLTPTYHDLAGSKTATFAQMRLERYAGSFATLCTATFDPVFPNRSFEAVVGLDFIEHLPSTEVARWAQAIYDTLEDGGVALFQNAFDIGTHNMEGGASSIPMHESSSGWTEEKWQALLINIGFIDTNNGWFTKL